MRSARLRLPKTYSCSPISFYGGEPLLETGLIREVIDLARREGPRDDYRFIVDTNGTRLDTETVALLVAERIDLQISLDGPAELHDRHRRYRGGGPTHADILAGLARLFAADPEAHGRVRYQVTLAPPSDPAVVGAWFAEFPPHRAAGIAEPPMVGANVAYLGGLEPASLGMAREEFQAFDDALDGRCLDCWAVRHCPLCFTALVGIIDAGSLPEAVCDGARRRVEGTLKMWVEMIRRNPQSLDFLRTSTVS